MQTGRKLKKTNADDALPCFSQTLVIHGELDYRVPYGNGLELHGPADE